MPLYLKLGLRFFRSKSTAALARFISFAATAGIAAGVFALIAGLSAMNGFERELTQRVLAVIPSAQIKAQHGSFAHAEAFAERLAAQPQIMAAAPVLELQAVLAAGGSFAPVLCWGVQPELQNRITAVEPFLSAPLSALSAHREPADLNDPLPLIIGAGIARRLGLETGSAVNLYVTGGNGKDGAAQDGADIFKSPKIIVAQVVGLLSIGGQLDSSAAFADLETLLKAAQLPGPNQIQLKTADLLAAKQQAYAAAAATAMEPCFVESWLSTQGKLYHDIQMIRGIMYLAMILVMAVASFNIVSTLVMAVSDKKKEIAILLTMGAPRALIVKAVCVMGLCSGLKGALIGAVLGTAAACWLTPVTQFFEGLLGVKFLNPEIYFIDFIPSEFHPADAVLVVGCALLMSLVAALYPALRAAKTQPALELNS